MLEKIPDNEEIMLLVGEEKFKVWTDVRSFVEDNYDMETLWNTGGKTGAFELKYRKSGKTLCALYPREQGLCILIIFGKVEREKFENTRGEFSKLINEIYDNTHQYHDGKWLYLDITEGELAGDIEKLLLIKKRPNKK